MALLLGGAMVGGLYGAQLKETTLNASQIAYGVEAPHVAEIYGAFGAACPRTAMFVDSMSTQNRHEGDACGKEMCKRCDCRGMYGGLGPCAVALTCLLETGTYPFRIVIEDVVAPLAGAVFQCTFVKKGSGFDRIAVEERDV